MIYLWVALGSALGGVGRYGFGIIAGRLWGEAFPWGTIAINVLGSFVIGFFATLTLPEGALPASPSVRIFVMVGLCGGFTTFSSFSLQTLTLARDGNWFGVMGNVLLSVFLCLLAVTLGHVSADRIGHSRRTEAATLSRGIPSQGILAILDRPETAGPVLAAARLAAGRFGGMPIEALHLRHDGLEGFMPIEEVMTERRAQEIEGVAARKSAEIHEIFDAWRQQSGSGTWREITGETARVILDEAAGSRLVVLGHAPAVQCGDARQAVHVVLFDARATALLVRTTIPASLGQTVAIAWKQSAAAERAIEAALPLLLHAGGVRILVEEAGALGTVPAKLLHVLEKAGVAVTVAGIRIGDRTIAEALIAEAHAVGADLLVMGAYSHSEISDLFGGATREILAASDLPILMHH